MTLPKSLREKRDEFIKEQERSACRCCPECFDLCKKAGVENGLMARSYDQGVADHAELVNVERLANSLESVLALIEDGILVRNTDNDADMSMFLNQGARLTGSLQIAQRNLTAYRAAMSSGDSAEETGEK